MKHLSFPSLLALSLLTVSVVRPPTTLGQVNLRPRVMLPAAAADYQMVRAGGKVYRYDARTGATQLLTVVSKPAGVAYVWTALSESVAPSEAEGDRYQVIEGSADTGILVRLDRKTGRTWVATSHGGAALQWEEVTK